MRKDKRKDEKTEEIVTDPFGSYTGVDTENDKSRPVQDADDL